MAGTQADMKARIASELVRSDLTADIANAITDAIAYYQNDRFRFMEPSIGIEPTFQTVASQMTYDKTTPLSGTVYPFLNATIGNLFAIDYLTYILAGIVFTIERNDALSVKIGNQNFLLQGQPQEFCYVGNALTVYPVPNTAYPVSIMGQLFVGAPANDTEAGNPWMTDAEPLIRSYAKYIIAKHKTRNAAMMQAMSPDPPSENGGVVGEAYRHWQNLKSVNNRIISRGRVKPMQF